MTATPKNYLPHASIAGSVLIFSVFAVLVRVMENYYTNSQQLGVRLTLAGIITVVICLIRKKKISDLKAIGFKKMLLYSAMTPVFLIFYINAVTATELLTAIVAFYSLSLTTAMIIGKYVFGEKPSLFQLCAIALSIVGLVVYGWPINDALSNVGFGFGILAGIADAINNSTKKMVKGKADPIVLVIPPLLVGGIASLIPGFVLHEQWKFAALDDTHIWHAIGWTILYSVLVVIVSYLLLYGFGHLSLATASLMLVAEIPVTGLYAWWIYSEKPTLQEAAGGFIVMASIALSSIEPKKKTIVADQDESHIIGETL